MIINIGKIDRTTTTTTAAKRSAQRVSTPCQRHRVWDIRTYISTIRAQQRQQQYGGSLPTSRTDYIHIYLAHTHNIHIRFLSKKVLKQILQDFDRLFHLTTNRRESKFPTNRNIFQLKVQSTISKRYVINHREVAHPTTTTKDTRILRRTSVWSTDFFEAYAARATSRMGRYKPMKKVARENDATKLSLGPRARAR
ncbi:unnamed protein product [Trichogramma brassicae]|uniref:Uncharacterized protein n=1 Tax=Trichogramma brassicae TaxID=86971 RepID=A0A6H5J379_9HYME|nr:unnamed protein product [Trichogramma brassicae]